jgi:uncharacterized membrane protein/nitrite reductase/ring-hydroxylating ferredoxin subunit
MPKDILQGKPLRHALHPFLVHFPIALFVMSFLLDLASQIFKPIPALVAGAYYSMLTGLLFALIAAVPGAIDYSDIRRDHKAKRVATFHMILNLLAVAIYGLNIGLRTGGSTPGATPLLPLFLSLACLGILSVSGYLGGSLVYDHGIGVGRHRRKTATPRETLHLSLERKPNEPEPEFVPVPGAKSLRPGETLRIELDKQIIVLANVHGEFVAFQEYCTHRFGPLSEGRLTDGEVQCLWHRSCFNVRTGTVVNGPAKEPLKTWATRVEGETVLLRVRPRPLVSVSESPAEPTTEDKQAKGHPAARKT